MPSDRLAAPPRRLPVLLSALLLAVAAGGLAGRLAAADEPQDGAKPAAGKEEGSTKAKEPAPKPTKGLRYPSLSPDGKRVAFAWRGDIWVAALDGSDDVRRLTIHEAQETLPRFSPDGKEVAFVSQRAGAYDLYVVSAAGGEPRAVTHHSAAEILCDWSPDGKRLLFLSNRDPSPYGLDVYEVPVAGGTPRRLTRDGGRDAAYLPDGKSIAERIRKEVEDERRNRNR